MNLLPQVNMKSNVMVELLMSGEASDGRWRVAVMLLADGFPVGLKHVILNGNAYTSQSI